MQASTGGLLLCRLALENAASHGCSLVAIARSPVGNAEVISLSTIVYFVKSGCNALHVLLAVLTAQGR